MTTTVVNLRNPLTPFDVYIGRPSIWGNPFKIGDQDPPWCNQTLRWNGTEWESGPLDREGVLYHYSLYLNNALLRDPDFLEPLRGKVLGCFCKPLGCHGDIIVELLGEAV